MKALKISMALVVALALWFAYVGFYKEPHARVLAEEFCASVKPGDAVDGLAERAVAMGADPRFATWVSLSDAYRKTDERKLEAIFTGVPPFSRHICRVKAAARVVDAQYDYLD